jgi:hypothetical protein
VKPCRACSPARGTSNGIRSLRDTGLSPVTVLPSWVDALPVSASRSRTAGVGACTRGNASRYRPLLWAEIFPYRNSMVTLLRSGTHAGTSRPSRRSHLRIRNSSGWLISVRVISGKHSTATMLSWFQDRSDPVLAQPWVSSVPVLVYCLAMFLWADWRPAK